MPLDPKTFPRPPSLEKVTRHLLIKWPGADGQVIADSWNSYWVLETYHPPTYYIPRNDVRTELKSTPRQTFCEWKGPASYFSIAEPGTGKLIENRVWTYPSPSSLFKDIAGYLSFYAGPWECYVDGEKADAQDGSFYGGWMTSDVVRENAKGRPGTTGW